MFKKSLVLLSMVLALGLVSMSQATTSDKKPHIKSNRTKTPDTNHQYNDGLEDRIDRLEDRIDPLEDRIVPLK